MQVCVCWRLDDRRQRGRQNTLQGCCAPTKTPDNFPKQDQHDRVNRCRRRRRASFRISAQKYEIRIKGGGAREQQRYRRYSNSFPCCCSVVCTGIFQKPTPFNIWHKNNGESGCAGQCVARRCRWVAYGDKTTLTATSAAVINYQDDFGSLHRAHVTRLAYGQISKDGYHTHYTSIQRCRENAGRHAHMKSSDCCKPRQACPAVYPTNAHASFPCEGREVS